jgi:hypothetical protein
MSTRDVLGAQRQRWQPLPPVTNPTSATDATPAAAAPPDEEAQLTTRAAPKAADRALAAARFRAGDRAMAARIGQKLSASPRPTTLAEYGAQVMGTKHSREDPSAAPHGMLAKHLARNPNWNPNTGVIDPKDPTTWVNWTGRGGKVFNPPPWAGQTKQQVYEMFLKQPPWTQFQMAEANPAFASYLVQQMKSAAGLPINSSQMPAAWGNWVAANDIGGWYGGPNNPNYTAPSWQDFLASAASAGTAVAGSPFAAT